MEENHKFIQTVLKRDLEIKRSKLIIITVTLIHFSHPSLQN